MSVEATNGMPATSTSSKAVRGAGHHTSSLDIVSIKRFIRSELLLPKQWNRIRIETTNLLTATDAPIRWLHTLQGSNDRES